MRIFFGKSHDYVNTTEQLLYQCLKAKNWNVYDALVLLKDMLLIQYENFDLYTINPLMLRFGVFNDYVYFLDNDNNVIKAIDDSIVTAKLNLGSSLDNALTTDERVMS